MSEPDGKKSTGVHLRRSFLKRLAGSAAASAVVVGLPALGNGSSIASEPAHMSRAARTKVSIHSLAVPRKKAK